MFNAYKRITALAMSALLVLGLTACGQGGTGIEPPDASPDVTGMPGYTQPGASTQPTQDAQPSPTPAESRRSTLYYRTDEGYMMPVQVQIPLEDGIAKACLAKLISTPETRSELTMRGLNPIIPEGTKIELNISDGEATVNLLNLPKLDSEEEERMMFMSIVNTLTEFPTVDTVTVYVDGKDDVQGHGSGHNLPKNQGRYAINPENSELATSGSAKPMILYFPNESGSMCIPVTRYVEGEPDLYSSIKALADGTELKGLRSCFPENTLVLAATIENGVLSVNLSSDFERVTETVGLYDVASNAVLLTAQQFGRIDEVRFLVNGTVFEP